MLNRLPLDVRNCSLHLFSGEEERIGFGATNFFPRTDDISTMLMRVFEKYLAEGVKMQQTNEEWRREFLKEVPLKDRLAGVSSAEVLKEFSPLDLIQALPPEVQQALPADILEKLKRNTVDQTEGLDDLTRQG